jgi:hypothetical protein
MGIGQVSVVVYSKIGGSLERADESRQVTRQLRLVVEECLLDAVSRVSVLHTDSVSASTYLRDVLSAHGRRELLRQVNRYHQQYLFKVPNGYCGIGGTGVFCPMGVAPADG